MGLAALFYFADISGSVMFTLIALGLGNIVLLIAYVGTVSSPTSGYYRDEKNKEIEERNKGVVKTATKGVIYSLIFFFVAALIPSKEGIYKMAAAYGVQSVAENPDVQRLAGKSLKLLEQSIDKYLPKGEEKSDDAGS